MILVCGEALVDLLVDPQGADLAARPVPGGSAFNCAVGLARLGAENGFTVGYLGGLSADVFGRWLRARLHTEGAVPASATESAHPTRIVAVSRDATGEPAYGFYGERVADLDLPADALMLRDDSPVRALVLGSFPIALEPSGDALRSLVAREAGRRLISLDPNLRPALTPPDAVWRGAFEACLAKADIVKASAADLATGYGEAHGFTARALADHAAGPALVIVTDGGNGARLHHRDFMLTVRPPQVRVVDAVGAGDSFHAAFLAALARYGPFDRAGLGACAPDAMRFPLAYAASAAALNCTRAGADPPDHASIMQHIGDAVVS
ncbi:MAG: fructokinase [Saliniramus fredricksonii]|uniref:Fructokinase n=1 Tax=Saliniramus fredricksonii TaxID=1653334 RepID=A0A0P7Y640_9HYPH|nr:PfkB family carbohydrate kinase [Saliniramus fredricksonii]KPQ09680.1 MAG: fructokinase [Saliniramus fredricksonii]SCC79803.1 fructokinase [Saliniramus fredricksonii]